MVSEWLSQENSGIMVEMKDSLPAPKSTSRVKISRRSYGSGFSKSTRTTIQRTDQRRIGELRSNWYRLPCSRASSQDFPGRKSNDGKKNHGESNFSRYRTRSRKKST